MCNRIFTVTLWETLVVAFLSVLLGSVTSVPAAFASSMIFRNSSFEISSIDFSPLFRTIFELFSCSIMPSNDFGGMVGGIDL